MFTKIMISLLAFSLINAQCSAMNPASAIDVKTYAESSTAERNEAQKKIQAKLARAIHLVDIPAVQELLKSPKTNISNDDINTYYLNSALVTAVTSMESHEDKKLIRLLLFVGFNPTHKPKKQSKSELEPAQEFAKKFSDKYYAKLMNDYQNMEKYCSPDELVEFGQIKKQRSVTHQALVHREISGRLNAKKMIAKKNMSQTTTSLTATALTPKITWPKK